MTSLKELLDIAKLQLKDLTTIQSPDFRLEEAEYKKDEKIWNIVVSYLVENTNKRGNPLAALTSEFQFHRMYKRIKIADDKTIVGLYIYNNKE
jgi:hypothetical protein